VPWADRSGGEQVEIGYCAPRGIPLSVFRGRVVYPGDPQWTDDDRQAVYDWLEKEANTCTGCGQSLGESMKKENSFAYRAEGLRCHGCYAIKAAEAKAERGRVPVTAGWRWLVTRLGSNGDVDQRSAAVSETEPSRG
jgi:hypothetical protein